MTFLIRQKRMATVTMLLLRPKYRANVYGCRNEEFPLCAVLIKMVWDRRFDIKPNVLFRIVRILL